MLGVLAHVKAELEAEGKEILEGDGGSDDQMDSSRDSVKGSRPQTSCRRLLPYNGPSSYRTATDITS